MAWIGLVLSRLQPTRWWVSVLGGFRVYSGFGSPPFGARVVVVVGGREEGGEGVGMRFKEEGGGFKGGGGGHEHECGSQLLRESVRDHVPRMPP